MPLFPPVPFPASAAIPGDSSPVPKAHGRDISRSSPKTGHPSHPISSCLLSPPIPFCVQSILQPILYLPSLAVLSPHILSHVHLFPSYAFLSCPSFSLRFELKVSVLQQTRGLRQCLGNPHWSAVTCVTSGHSLLPAGGAAAGGCG